MRRYIFISWRWIEIVVFSFLGCIALFLGKRFIPNSIFETLANLDNFWFVFCLGIILLVYLNWIAGFRFRHFQSLIKYPSFLFAVILASLVSPTTLDNLLRFNERSGNNQPRDWKKWAWLGSILLENLKKYPQKFAPQISIVLGLSYTPNPQLPKDFLLNEPILDGLFGVQARDVIVEMAKSLPIDKAIKGSIEWIDFSLIQPRSQKWLEKHKEVSP